MNSAPDDLLFRQLSRLAPVVSNDGHTARVRARCHAALADRRRHARATDLVVARRRRWELAVAGGVVAAYLSAVIQQALVMYGLG